MGSGIMPLVEKTVLQCEVARLIGEWRKLDKQEEHFVYIATLFQKLS